MAFHYFNAAGASLVSQQVVEAQYSYIKEEQSTGGYLCAINHQADWERLYELIARLVNVKTEQVALQESASRGLMNALLSLPWEKDDEIIITELEYGANYAAFLRLKEKFGLTIKIATLVEGAASTGSIESLLTEKTKLVCLTWIPSHNGVINPIEEVGILLHSHPCYFLVDACQAVGQIKIDCQKVHSDFIVASGRKFLRAPRGTGFLVVSDRVLSEGLMPLVSDHFASPFYLDETLDEEVLIGKRNDAKRFELWEASMSARFGFKVALEELFDEGEINRYQKMQMLSKKCRKLIDSNSRIVCCDTGQAMSSIITFYHQDLNAEEVIARLASQQVITSMVSQSAGILDMKRRKLDSLVRVSPHIYNSSDDLNALGIAIASLK